MTSRLLLVAMLVFAPAALAAETHPDCEASQRGGAAPVCEGEHWEGEDTTGAAGTDLVNVGPSGAAVSWRAGPEPGKPDPRTSHPLDAAQARASVGDGAYSRGAAFGVASVAAYADGGLLAVWFRDDTDSLLSFLGMVETWDEAYERVEEANPTRPAGEEGGHGTDGNVLWSFVHLTHVTHDGGAGEEHSPSSEAPCTQADYEHDDCIRDNTAVTVELLP